MSEAEIPKAEKPDGVFNLEYPTRYLCAVLDEMRKCNETRNFAPMLSLIEEAQVLGNRMESALEAFKGIRAGEEYRQNLKDEIKALEARRDELRKGKKPSNVDI